jgi:hypothetical protein
MGPTDEEEMYFFLILEFFKKKICPCSVYYRYINLWKTHLGNVSVPLERDLHVLYHGQKHVCFVGGTAHWCKSEQSPQGSAA